MESMDRRIAVLEDWRCRLDREYPMLMQELARIHERVAALNATVVELDKRVRELKESLDRHFNGKHSSNSTTKIGQAFISMLVTGFLLLLLEIIRVAIQR